jgi:hypothetical protein
MEIIQPGYSRAGSVTASSAAMSSSLSVTSDRAQRVGQLIDPFRAQRARW